VADQAHAKPNVREAVPFFGVADMAASLRFYLDGLGFRMTNCWTPDEPGPDGSPNVRWCWLQFGGASIMLQEYLPEHGLKAKRGEGFTVCFMCEDALAIFREAGGRGLGASRRPFVGNNMWVVGFTDPDGYDIDFESPTDVPEGTEYDPALHH
jgi:catechol 2,3-dioxygenase-like lactoylglutathione lyase family enzyme